MIMMDVTNNFEEEDSESTFIEMIIAAIPAALHEIVYKCPIPLRTSILTGQLYYEELVNSRNEVRFIEVVRMRKETFFLLLDKLKINGLKNGKKVCAGEKAMILIYILCGHSSRNTQERFQHSGDTITKVVRQVLTALMQLKRDYIRLPTSNQVPYQIRSNSKFHPYFRNCDGCFDGTHIAAVPSVGQPLEPYRNRKGYNSQNVLGVIDFDMLFTFVHAGWEGSAHDGRVLNDSVEKGFECREGKFYLADAGYALTSWCLTPYRGVRYHLKEWKRGRQKPQNKEELFNLRHSQARNVIERGYGVMKKRFPILKNMPAYPYAIQVGFVFACFVLHNFIRIHQSIPDQYDDWDDEEVEVEIQQREMHIDETNVAAANWRDSIAEAMWRDYTLFSNLRNNII